MGRKRGRKRLDELGSLQHQVMEALWRKGEATVQDVLDAITGPRVPAYTTVLSVLQKLEKAGWVRHRRDGRRHVYIPCRTREQEGAKSLRSFIDGVFRGDPLLLFQHLLADEQIDAADLETLRDMIERRRREDGDAADATVKDDDDA